MVLNDPTTGDHSTVDPGATDRAGVDAASAAVRVVLALYLLPVLLLVALIGVTSILVGALARGLDGLVNGSRRTNHPAQAGRIGVGPIALKPRERPRVSR